MELKDKINLVICLMLVLGGSLFVTIAVREWFVTWQIIQLGEKTQGTVVENVRRPRKVGDKGTPNSLAPVIQFTTQRGEPQTYYSTLYTSPARYQVGEAVEIWYLPDDPVKAALKDGDAWVLPLVFGIFGLAMCLIAYPWLIRILIGYFRKSHHSKAGF